MRVLVLLFGILLGAPHALASVPMPPSVVLIVCKVNVAPYASDTAAANAAYTGHVPFEWATEHSMMVCRRHEVQMYDPAEAKGADPKAYTKNACQRSGIYLGSKWNVEHSRWKWWRTACPVPIVDTETGRVIAWKMPECGHRDTVRCETDAEI